jgi:hypothetical protein
MVWPLTVDTWTFHKENLAQSRLQRHLVHLQRTAR